MTKPVQIIISFAGAIVILAVMFGILGYLQRMDTTSSDDAPGEETVFPGE